MAARRLAALVLVTVACLSTRPFGQAQSRPFGEAQGRPAAPGMGTIAVDAARPGAAIPKNLYGIFFEEISHAGDGGLYAELIQNRGFEDANLPPACTLENGFISPPRTPHFDTNRPSTWRLRWDASNPHPAWSLQSSAGADAAIALTTEQPLNDATPHSLRVTIGRIPQGERVALVNDGYWGMAVAKGERYTLTFYMRADAAFRGPVTPQLVTQDGRPLATSVVGLGAGSLVPSAPPAGAAGRAVAPANASPVSSWRKYTTTLTATDTDPKARFALAFASPGQVWVDFVSLFPAKTFKNRPNGLRPDLAQVIADLKPGFVRGPGGCFAEGITVESRPQWKRSIGPIEQRVGTYSPWGYWSTDGLGYHEFLQFSEDIGADALWVVNVGVSCSFRSGTFLPDEALPGLIQDTLDAIEYAIGPVTSTWGAVRATNGHPAPFPLKYIEIGNEQQGARYGARVAQFAKAIKAKYPRIKVSLSSWIAGIDRAAIGAAGKIDIVDEHAYKPLHWAVQNFDSFASYKREGWDLYIGEFATNAGVGRGNLVAALNDAVYMMSVEKNTDLVKMASYAPLLENVNKRDWEVNMIHFDSSRVFQRGSYYVQKLFAENQPDVSLPARVTYESPAPRPIGGRIGVSTYNTAAEFKDVLVEKNGTVLYRSNFSQDAPGWTPDRGRGNNPGRWSVQDGAYRQSEQAVSWTYLGDESWSDLAVSLKARKISGAEGFIVSVGYADGRRVQWNVGGWGNRQHAVQVADAIVGRPVPGQVQAGRWYDVKIEVRDRTLKCYLDGALVDEQTLARVDTVLAIAGKDTKTGTVIIKAVNTSPDPASMTMTLEGAGPMAALGQAIVLTSANPTDENSFETPTKIVPVTSALKAPSPTFTRTLPPYSLTIMRVGGRR